tara:strand:+ start:2358 stop:2891 length:534 start_codon:yes stop_codon:yes gene_type:complete
MSIQVSTQNSTATRGIDFGGANPTSTIYTDGVFHTAVKGSIIAKANSTYTLSTGPGVFTWNQRPDNSQTTHEVLHLILQLASFSIAASGQTFQESEYVELSTTISPFATSIQNGIIDFFKISKPPNPNGQDPYSLAPATFNWNVCITYTPNPPIIALKFNSKKISEFSLVKGFYYIY